MVKQEQATCLRKPPVSHALDNILNFPIKQKLSVLGPYKETEDRNQALGGNVTQDNNSSWKGSPTPTPIPAKAPVHSLYLSCSSHEHFPVR